METKYGASSILWGALIKLVLGLRVNFSKIWTVGSILRRKCDVHIVVFRGCPWVDVLFIRNKEQKLKRWENTTSGEEYVTLSESDK